MTARSYLIGSLLLLVALGPLVAAALRVRARILPEWRGGHARLVEAVLAFAAFWFVLHLLGAVGLFRRGPVVAALFACGVTAWALARPPRSDIAQATPSLELDKRDRSVAVVITGLVAAMWAHPTLSALRSGVLEIDSLSFRLPIVAHFVQDGWLTRIHHPFADYHTTFYPFDSELVHAFGLLAFGRDVMSPLINLGWAALLLLAAWTAGRRVNAPTASFAVVAALLVMPGIVATQPGTAGTDVTGLFFFVAAVVVLLKDHRSPGALVVAGLAAGAAMGIKQNYIAPTAVLTLCVLFIALRQKRQRALSALAWIVSVGVTGSFWYVRNAVHTGSPIPGLDVSIGPIDFSGPRFRLLEAVGDTLAERVLDTTLWSRFFLPGLRLIFGPLWPVLLLLAAAGCVLAFSKKGSILRVVAITALGSAVAYIFTPATAGGIRDGDAEFFAPGLRYLLTTMALGLIITVVVAAKRWPDKVFWLSIAGLVLVVSVPGASAWNLSRSAIGIAVVVVMSAAVLLWISRRPRRFVVVFGAMSVIFGLGAGFLLQRYYLDRRYMRAGEFAFRWPEYADAVSSIQRVSDARIGVAGFSLQYPLFGADMSNDVEYVGDLRPNGEFTDFTTCEEWRTAVNRGSFDYLLIALNLQHFPQPPLRVWTERDDAAHPLMGRPGTSLYRITGSMQPDEC